MTRGGNTLLRSLISGAFLVALLCHSGTALPQVTDESLRDRSGDAVEARERSADEVKAVKQLADYLERMGSREVADKLRADFKSGRVHIGRIDANAEVNPGILGIGRSMALSDTLITQMGTDKVRAREDVVAGWALTVFHEYVHMKQWMPMEDSWHETPAWGATLRENGRWIRRTLDEIDRVGRDTSLTPQTRAERLQELRKALAAQHGVFKVTLNELRGKLAKGALDKHNGWQGVPPAEGREATGTTDLDALEKSADAFVKAGGTKAAAQSAEPYVEIVPRPGTARVGEKIKLTARLHNMPAGHLVPHYGWTVSHNGVGIASPTEERLSYTVAKAGRWTMRVLVQARDGSNRLIRGREGDGWLEDSISMKVEEAAKEAVDFCHQGSPGGASINIWIRGVGYYEPISNECTTFQLEPGLYKAEIQWTNGLRGDARIDTKYKSDFNVIAGRRNKFILGQQKQ